MCDVKVTSPFKLWKQEPTDLRSLDGTVPRAIISSLCTEIYRSYIWPKIVSLHTKPMYEDIVVKAPV